MENKKLAPIFARWMEPFHYLGFTTLRSRVQGGDHLHFRYLGIVTTSFLQDQYPSWASHTNMDTFERLIEADLQQSAAVVASFVYHAANREEMLPRHKALK